MTNLLRLIWLRRLKAGAGGVIKTITGAVPLVFDALAGKIKSLTQYGLCVQDGTPTPSAPVDIKCNNGVLKMVDDELPIGYRRVLGIDFDGSAYYMTGEKLYGSDVVTMTLSNTSTTGQNVFGAYSGTAAGNKNFSLYVYGGNSTSNSYLRYNETLYRPRYGAGERTISFGAGGTDGFLTDVSFDEATFESSATAYIGALPNSTSPKFTGTINGTITVGTRLKYVPCERVADNVVGYYEVNGGVFLEPQAGTPTFSGYDPSHLTLKVVGTPEVLSVGGKNLNGGTIENKGYTSTGGESTSTTFAGTLWQIPCEAGQKFTVSWGGFPDGVSGVFINTWKTDGTWNTRQAISASTSLTYTIGAGISIVNFTLYKTGGITIGENAWIQVEYGDTATDYQPYREPQTATVPDLFAVGDYKDEVDIISGAVTRKCGILVLDGTESNLSYSSSLMRIALDSKLVEKSEMFCTHFLYSSTTSSNCPNGGFGCGAASTNVWFNNTSLTSLDAWRAWLAAQYAAGTPVIVIYPLAEETTESVTAQPLTTAAGTNTISATAEVSPITLDIEYKGAAA